MDRRRKYWGALSWLAWRDARKFLRRVGGDYGQVVFSVVFFAIGFIATYRGGQGHDLLVDLGPAIMTTVAGVIVVDALISVYFLSRSGQRLFEEIGVERWADLNARDPGAKITEWMQMRQQRVVLFVQNNSAYKLSECKVKIKGIAKPGDARFSFPKEGRPLEWLDERVGQVDIGTGSDSTKSIAVFFVEGDMMHFVTHPPNPHKLTAGRYLVKLELHAEYWWRDYTCPVNLEVILLDSNGVTWRKA